MSEPVPDPSQVSAVCHVRAPLLLEPVDAKVETLRRCEAAGTVSDLAVRSWPGEVVVDRDAPYAEIVDRFEEFSAWADRNGVSVEPPVQVRTTTSMVTDESRRVLVTPLLCLALYLEDRLLAVYPHTDGETTVGAPDAIATLKTGDLPPVPRRALGEAVARDIASGGTSGSSPDDSDATDPGRVDDSTAGGGERPSDSTAGGGGSAPATPRSCPGCEGSLVNVQGLLSCPACGWSDARLAGLRSSTAKLVYLALVERARTPGTLQDALDLDSLTVYGVLRTLTDRGLVERADGDSYRAVVPDRELESVPSNR